MHLSNKTHVVNIIPPIDVNGAGASSDVFSMELYDHATIYLTLGVTGAACTVTLEECDNLTPTTDTAIAFKYYAETTAAGDTLGALTAATSAGFATSANDNVTYVIEIDAADLTDGYPCLQLEVSDPSAATLVSAIAVLSGPKYASASTPTAIA